MISTTFANQLMEIMHNYSKLNFSTVLPEVVQKFSHLPAMCFVGEEPITYSQMGGRIASVIKYLKGLNLEKGDKVVLYSQNMPNWGIVYYAVQCLGIIIVPVLPDFNSHELTNVLKHSEAKTMFISDNLEYRLKEIDQELLQNIIRINDLSILKGDSEKIVLDDNLKLMPPSDPDENDLSVLLYTSGTTGDSKGVMLSQKNILINVFQAAGVQPIAEGDRFLSVLPLSHTYENTLGLNLPILSGGYVHYLRKPPIASVLLPALKKVGPQFILTVPMIIEKIYRTKILAELNSKKITKSLMGFKPTRVLLHRIAGKKLYQSFGGNLKFFGIGGAKLDAAVEQFLRDAKFPYAIGYGLTETAPMLAGSNPQMTKFQAIGPKVKEIELIINKPDPLSGEGEIWAKGPNIMMGYYKNPEKTKEVLTDDGWFRTGDLGVFDKQGWLSHKGRLKNLILGANGENIYPEEVESLINNFRHVIESIVVEKKGKITALVHFNREEIEEKLKAMRKELGHKVDDKIEELSKRVDEAVLELSIELKKHINAKVNKFSRIQFVVVQNDPFLKTATLKIKRYLYC